MAQVSLLPHPGLLELQRIISKKDALILVVRSQQTSCACPQCHRLSDKVHSCYQRRLKDLCLLQSPTELHLKVKKFFLSP